MVTLEHLQFVWSRSERTFNMLWRERERATHESQQHFELNANRSRAHYVKNEHNTKFVANSRINFVFYVDVVATLLATTLF